MLMHGNNNKEKETKTTKNYADIPFSLEQMRKSLSTEGLHTERGLWYVLTPDHQRALNTDAETF